MTTINDFIIDITIILIVQFLIKIIVRYGLTN